MKISIHRALSSLKILEKRINKLISNFNGVGMQIQGKVGLMDSASFIAREKSLYQSIHTLIEDKLKLKTLILESNNKTMVTIAKNKMSVTQAILFKEMIPLKNIWLNKLIKQHGNIAMQIDRHNQKVDERALSIAQAALGAEAKATQVDAMQIIKPFVTEHKAILADAIGIQKVIDAYQEELLDFTAEVDAILSESNAITLIEI